MWATIAALLTAIAALFKYLTKKSGFLISAYKDYFSLKIRRRKFALKKGEKAIDEGNKYELLDAINDSKK